MATNRVKDLKKFRGQRIYVATQYPGIKKILVWDSKAKQYLAPVSGAKFLARKQICIDGRKKTINKHADSLQVAFSFRSESLPDDAEDHGPKIGVLIDEYKASPAWDLLSYSTQIMYEGLFERWFDLIADVPVRKLDPGAVSGWIQLMKRDVDRFGNAKNRRSFRKEFDLLKSLLTWYGEYKDDAKFRSPIKRRHQEEYWLDDKAHLTVDQDFRVQVSDEVPLTELEYQRFRNEFVKSKFGETLAVLADVQYEHSLRVCEAAALMWQDIKPENPEWTRGEIKFQRHIQYIHRNRTKYQDRIVPGLKNKRAIRRVGKRFYNRDSLSKIHPFFPRSSRGLRELYLKAEDKKGLVFVHPTAGSFFGYKCIKDRYDRAFKRAGLDYRGTHIIRYGGVNNFIARYGADEDAAMELLGNKNEGRYVLRRSRKVHQLVER